MSSKLPWTRLFAGKWLLDLAYLPAIEGNVYMRLRLQMLHTREPLVHDAQILSHFTCCSVKRFEKALDYLFRSGHVICLENGRLWISDVEEELNNSDETLNKFAERAAKAASTRKNKHQEDSSRKPQDSSRGLQDSSRCLEDSSRGYNNNNNNSYNKKTNTIVLSKKEICSESLEPIDLVEEPTEVRDCESQSEQIATDVENQPPIHEQENISQKAKRAQANRGCRLPEDFKPDYEFAIEEGLPPERVNIEEAKFRDYWNAKTGKDATKHDWQATWRNWVRRVIEKLEERKNYEQQRSQGQKSVGERIADSVLDIGARGYFESSSQHDSAGFPLELSGWYPVDQTARNDCFRGL
ncbi:hypothetical protein [Bartonella sp. C271]|uniref:hypothetical protein n=1 Tax=Bartonella sp. C271 TaxID=3070220 RepID=UPI0038B55A8C